MDIKVTGRKMNVGEALTQHAQDRLASISDKYFSRTIDASTTFIKEGPFCRVDVSMHPNQGINLHSRAESDDAYGAFEQAAEKIEKQLRRYKRRLKNHHNLPGREAVQEIAISNIIAPHADEEDDSEQPAPEGDDQPIIIAEASTEIPKVSVGDAVMLMDLADTVAFMFRNQKTDQLEVVYKRTDGNIGWISPARKS